MVSMVLEIGQRIDVMQRMVKGAGRSIKPQPQSHSYLLAGKPPTDDYSWTDVGTFVPTYRPPSMRAKCGNRKDISTLRQLADCGLRM